MMHPIRRADWYWLGLALLVACRWHPVEQVVIRGSDTELNLVLQLAEAYMAEVPAVSVAVTGGGSGTGIAALINRKTDIANASRRFKASEEALAEARGVAVRPIVFALDALCFIVPADLPVDSLSLEELRAIFTGAADNWSAFGGPDRRISLYGRQGNSGTYGYIQEELLRADYSPHMKQMNGSSQIVEGVRADAAGIGYVGVGYVVDKAGQVSAGIKVLAIKADAAAPALSPADRQHIVEGRYPLVRPLYQYVDGRPSGQTLAFLEYELSAAGQAIIEAGGYFPLTPAYRAANHTQLYADAEPR